MPARDVVKNNMVLNYRFETNDVYENNGIMYVADKSGNGNDAAFYGSAAVNGVLDLTQNTTDVTTNGYAVAPEKVLDGARSYTFALRINAKNLNSQPRLYDFGKDAGNSVFLRASALSAGIKYNGGTTTMVSPSSSLTAGKEYFLTVTFDAKTQITTVYIDGEAVGWGTNNKTEAYRVSGSRNYIGRTQWWDTTVAKDNMDFCGTIDDFMLFNTALTADEITKFYKKNTAKITMDVQSEADSIRIIFTKENIPDEAVLIAAVYSGGLLVKAEIVSSDSVIMPQGDTVKVFCFESKASVKPICPAQVKEMK